MHTVCRLGYTSLAYATANMSLWCVGAVGPIGFHMFGISVSGVCLDDHIRTAESGVTKRAVVHHHKLECCEQKKVTVKVTVKAHNQNWLYLLNCQFFCTQNLD